MVGYGHRLFKVPSNARIAKRKNGIRKVMKVKAYAMTIFDNHSSKPLKVKFELIKPLNITNLSEYKAICQNLSRATRKDGKGRILCSGAVSYDRESQKRLYVVKKSHSDGSLWQQDNVVASNFLIHKK